MEVETVAGETEVDSEAAAMAADSEEAGLEDGEATAAERVRKCAIPTMHNMSIPKR